MPHWIDSLPDNPDSIVNVLSAQGRILVRIGSEYIHSEFGRVLVIASHPHDGACLIIERMVDNDPECDERMFDTCERSDLVDAIGEQWPYLGFTRVSK